MNWIPCREKMPGEGERVLYWTTPGEAVAGARHKYNDGDGVYHKWEGNDWSWEDDEVTHWAKIEKPEGV